MPPKARITKNMVVDAAVEIIRESGLDGLNARVVAQKLGCSTQPVLYCFATMEDLKKAAYAQVDQLHSDYLMYVSDQRNPLLDIGLNYIRFAVEEPQLFRFLFQSGYAVENTIVDMIDSEELMPVLAAMQEGMGLSLQKTKEAFLTLALFVHGYASIIANNNMEFDEHVAAVHLERAFNGAVAAASQKEA